MYKTFSTGKLYVHEGKWNIMQGKSQKCLENLTL